MADESASRLRHGRLAQHAFVLRERSQASQAPTCGQAVSDASIS